MCGCRPGFPGVLGQRRRPHLRPDAGRLSHGAEVRREGRCEDLRGRVRRHVENHGCRGTGVAGADARDRGQRQPYHHRYGRCRSDGAFGRAEGDLVCQHHGRAQGGRYQDRESRADPRRRGSGGRADLVGDLRHGGAVRQRAHRRLYGLDQGGHGCRRGDLHRHREDDGACFGSSEPGLGPQRDLLRHGSHLVHGQRHRARSRSDGAQADFHRLVLEKERDHRRVRQHVRPLEIQGVAEQGRRGLDRHRVYGIRRRGYALLGERYVRLHAGRGRG